MKKILVYILASLLLIILVFFVIYKNEITGNVVLNQNLISFEIPTQVIYNNTFELKCNYGDANLNCVGARHNGVECLPAGKLEDTFIVFNCKASSIGQKENSCFLFPNEADYRCPLNIKETRIKNITVLPEISGTFLFPEFLNISQIPSVMDDIKNLGMGTIILYGTRKISENCTSNYYWIDDGILEKLEIILNESQKRGINVYIGLSKSVNECRTLFTDKINYYKPSMRESASIDSRFTVIYLLGRLGGYSSLAGWYIPDEPDLLNYNQDYNITEVYLYYSNIVSAIRENSDKPILVSSSLIGAEKRTTQETAILVKDFKDKTKVDIILIRDSVGTDAFNIDKSKGVTTEDYYKAILNLTGKGTLWSQNEVFNYGDDSHRPTLITRIIQQLELSSSLNKRIIWDYNIHLGYENLPRIFGGNNPDLSEESNRLRDSYEALFGTRLQYIKPSTYQWVKPALADYPDSGNEMFNNKLANPKNFANNIEPEWTGIYGNAEIIIDMRYVKRIKWISANFLNNKLAGISFPEKIRIFCSDDSLSWNERGSWNSPLINKNETANFVFSNSQPLEINCRYLKLIFENQNITFIDEIEIIGYTNELSGNLETVGVLRTP